MSVVAARTLGAAAVKTARRLGPKLYRVEIRNPSFTRKLQAHFGALNRSLMSTKRPSRRGPRGRSSIRFGGSRGPFKKGGEKFIKALDPMPVSTAESRRKVATTGLRHYFTQAGWRKFGHPALKQARAHGGRLKVEVKRGPGKFPIDKWQVLAGLGAAASGLAARRRRRR